MPQFFQLTVKSSNLQHKNTFLKSNRQYLKNQQTFLITLDSPCQTVLNFFGFLFTPAQFKSIWNEPLSEYMYFNLHMFNHCTLDENPTGGYLAWISPIEAG